MTAACHDPTNVRTLDKSGNNLHFRFGDGATSTLYPTKLSARGYSSDGSNDYFQALANQTNAITSGTWAVFYRQTVISSVRTLYSHRAIADNRGVLYVDGAHVAFYCGDNLNNSYILNIAVPKQATFAAGLRTTDGYRRIFVNGYYGVPNNLGVSLPSVVIATNPVISGISIGVPLNGDFLWYGHWEYALTELQLRDLEARLRRQLNDV